MFLHIACQCLCASPGIFFVGYAVFTIPSTFICARVGAPVFLGSILVMWGLVASLFAGMRNQWQFYVLRFLLGLTESGAYPGMPHPYPATSSLCAWFSLDIPVAS